MATIMETGAVATVATGRVVGEAPPPLTITLYDLMAALQEAVGADDDTLVVAAVVRLLRSGRLTRPGTARSGRRMRSWSY
jgi:hypothetical protein